MAIKDLRIDIKPELRKLDVYARRSVLSKSLEGEMSTAFKGRGIEFAGFRNYVFGDDAKLIDWRASKRANDVLIREFEEYRNTTIFFLFDVSDSMLFSSTSKLKCEYAAETIYVLADAMLKSGDEVGMSMFNDNIINTVYPGMGQQILNNMQKNILNGKNYGGGFDLKKALLLTKSLLKERAVIMLVSDMFGIQENWETYIKMLGSRFEVINIMILDPVDLELPSLNGRLVLKNPYDKDNLIISTNQLKKRYKEENLKRIKFIEISLRKSKGDCLVLRTDQDPVDEIVKFFNRRAKRTE
ncbi:MAG: DUF58 domain-containing protein [Candidatus Woesearchaeota archaeon]